MSMFSDYASYYDLLYKDKDYRGETQYIAGLIEKILHKQPMDLKLLDLACGTGKHAMELARLGYKVDGSDISKEMIDIATNESMRNKTDITFFNQSFQTANNIKKKYDVILSMFSSIDYLTTYSDLAATFRNVYSLLSEDGVFIFDFWNGNAVIKDFSPVRVKRIKKENKEVIRITDTTLDRIKQTATLRFTVMLLENGILREELHEEHVVRYYFLQEMVDYLEINNFEILFKCPFMKPEDDINCLDWNVTYIVQRKNIKYYQ